MKPKTFAMFFWIIYLCLPAWIYSSTTERIQIQRPNGSFLVSYLTIPEGLDTYPIALVAHGSQCESIRMWHEDFSMVSTEFGAALVTIEKQGIYSPEEIDSFEYNNTNTFDNRVEDHLLFIQKLREKEVVPQWNGSLMMIGGSEGGRVAITLSAQVPEVKATALFTCGGGLPSIDELKIAFMKFMISLGEADEELASIMLLLDEKISEIMADPSPEKFFLSCTYKWWASHLNRHYLKEIIQIDHPIFYVHGTADQVIPIESADKVADTFALMGKKNLIYFRLEDYDHDMRQFPHEILVSMFEMLQSQRPVLFPKLAYK